MSRIGAFVLLIACGHPPAHPSTVPGQTREAAIPIELAAETSSLHGATRPDIEASATPSWYRIELPDDRRHQLEVSATMRGAGALDVELLAAGGATLDQGPGFARTDDARGRVYIRVTGTVRGYGLAVIARPSPEPPTAWPACNVHDIDPANPRCAGVVPCDPNRPDFTIPACCEVACIRDCNGTLEPIPDTRLAWIDKGAAAGINTRYRGRGWLATAGGSGTSFTFAVVSVERTRAKVAIATGVPMAEVKHAVAKLLPPIECGGSAD